MYAHVDSDITYGYLPIATSDASFYSEGLAIMPVTMRLSNIRSRFGWPKTSDFFEDEGMLQGDPGGGERN
jgi:hypothetical protein